MKICRNDVVKGSRCAPISLTLRRGWRQQRRRAGSPPRRPSPPQRRRAPLSAGWPAPAGSQLSASSKTQGQHPQKLDTSIKTTLVFASALHTVVEAVFNMGLVDNFVFLKRRGAVSWTGDPPGELMTRHTAFRFSCSINITVK